jgi:hypothetical protein
MCDVSVKGVLPRRRFMRRDGISFSFEEASESDEEAMVFD